LSRATRVLVVALAGVALIAAGCGGGGDVDPDTARLRTADQALEKSPGDPFAMADVIRAAASGAGHRVDTGTGRYQPSARRFLNRAAAVWPRYVKATRDRPDSTIASLMVGVYSNGLERPADAARAAEFVALDRPSAASYLSLAELASRAGNRRKAELAAQKALELAEPEERARVRAAIRLFLHGQG
jgi:hypothetical protein